MRFLVITATLIALSATPAIAADDAKVGAVQDQIAYLTSFSAPVMNELCAPLLPSYPKAFEPLFPKWLSSNTASIERGRQLAMSKLESGKTIEEFEQSTLDAHKQQFASVAKDRQLNRCMGMLVSLSVAPR